MYHFVWFRLDPRLASVRSTRQVLGVPHLLLGPGPEDSDAAIMFTSIDTAVEAFRNLGDESAMRAFISCDPRLVSTTEPGDFRTWIGKEPRRGLFTSGSMAVLGVEIQGEHVALFEDAVPISGLIFAVGDA